MTVLMPVFDGAPYLREAIDSVLAQTFSDFELLLCDDGSRDGSREIMRSYSDPRVRLRFHEKNLGHFATRNQQLPSARGEYVAMLDADDYAFSDRLARQVAFLDAHAGHALVGSWAAEMNVRSRTRGLLTRPLAADDVRAQQLFIACFKHSSIMARRSVLLAHPYPEGFPVSQDVVLWNELADHYPIANLPEILIRYREHSGGISKHQKALVREVKLKIASKLLAALEVEHSPQDLARHYLLRTPRKAPLDRAFLDWAAGWLVRLMAANARSCRYPEPAFARAIGDRWFELCTAALLAGVAPGNASRGTPLPRLARASFRRHARLYGARAPHLASRLLFGLVGARQRTP